MMIKSAQISDKGPRPVNQDAIFSYQEDDLALYVVADGMGGHLFGEVASGMIVDAASEWVKSEQYKALIKSGEIQEVMDDLEEVLMQANRRLYEEHNQGSNISGSTLVLLLLYRDCCGILTIGDSHIYQLGRNKKTIEQISTDDVWENDPARTQGLTKEQIDQDPRKGRLLHAFGIEERVEMHRATARLRGDRVYLLCSDGIYKYAPDGALDAAMRQAEASDSLDDVLRKLQMSVTENGGKDNYSAILVKVTGLPEELEPDAEKAADEERTGEIQASNGAEQDKNPAEYSAGQNKDLSKGNSTADRTTKKTPVLMIILCVALLLCAMAVGAFSLGKRSAQQEASEVQEEVTTGEDTDEEIPDEQTGNEPEQLSGESTSEEPVQEKQIVEEQILNEQILKEQETEGQEQIPEDMTDSSDEYFGKWSGSVETPETIGMVADEFHHKVTESTSENENLDEDSVNESEKAELMKEMKESFQAAYDDDVRSLRQQSGRWLEENIRMGMQKDSAESLYYAAVMYDEGILQSGEQNRDLAKAYYEKAAEGAGEVKGISLYRLGYLYEKNLLKENAGYGDNSEQAEAYYKQALQTYDQIKRTAEKRADQGNKEAAVSLKELGEE